MESKPQKVDLRALFNRSYAGQYITPVEIDHPIKVKITSLTTEIIRPWQKGRKPEEKLILRFEGKERGMVINKTNFKKLANAFGWDPEEWVGQEITIETVEVEAGGRVVDSIVVTPITTGNKHTEKKVETPEVGEGGREPGDPPL